MKISRQVLAFLRIIEDLRAKGMPSETLIGYCQHKLDNGALTELEVAEIKAKMRMLKVEA
jgi:hypothetical protein